MKVVEVSDSKVVDSKKALAQVVEDWNQAASPWDPAALTAVYEDDGLMYAGRPHHVVGREAIHEYFASYVGDIFSAHLTMPDPFIRELGEGALLVQGPVYFKFVLSGDEHTRTTMRGTLVLVNRSGRWRILQHHFSSVPDAPPLGRN